MSRRVPAPEPFAEFDLGLWMMVGMGLVFVVWFLLRDTDEIVHDDDDEFEPRRRDIEEDARRNPF